MTSTYTDNLRITKQGDNDNPNTWGQIVNTQIITLLEEAVTGVISIDCTGSSDINIATTVANGATDTARHAVLELTGTIGANINLILPSVEKVYIIKAAFTGAFTITVKPTGGSTGIAFTNTKAGLVYTNGTSITEIVPTLSDGDKGDITITGGVWAIDANAVTETKIADDAVTAAKIATGAVTNDALNATTITGQTAATVAADDLILISDTNDTALLKKGTIDSVINITASVLANKTDTVIAVDDKITFYDTTDTSLPKTDTVQGILDLVPASGLGIGQTWQNMTSTRALGTTYTNTTGKPISVFYTGVALSTNAAGIFYVNGSTFSTQTTSYSYDTIHFSVIIPNNNTYAISDSTGMGTWWELR